MPSGFLSSTGVLAAVAGPTGVQPMPSRREVDAAMWQIQCQLERFTLEQCRMSEPTYQQMAAQSTPGAEDSEIVMPRRDDDLESRGRRFVLLRRAAVAVRKAARSGGLPLRCRPTLNGQ